MSSPRCAADAAERKRLGVWYTPPSLVAAIIDEVVYPGARSVLDPACGDGRFLAASGLPEQVGVDIDPTTQFEHDDSLRRDWGDRRFDVVVGNPPFLSQLAAATSRGGRSRFGGGPYADAAAEFMALALRLTRPGGRFGLVLPQSLLSTRDAADIRAEVQAHAALRWMWWSPTQMFDASVRVWAGVWEVGAVQGEVRRSYGPEFATCPPASMPRHAVNSSWASLLGPHDASPADGPASGAPAAGGGRVLGDVALFSADFREQYYGLVGAVGDDMDGPPLVTSGLIDPGRCLWGARPARFARQAWHAPRVSIERLSPSMQRWAERRLVPKILIANQTRVIEAVFDAEGAWLPAVPVISCVTDEAARVLDLLQSDAAHAWVHRHAAGSGLGAGTVRLSPALLASIPLPG
ncbi:MAG: class I SAM-dependent DNA methyltransferase [Ilumatobacteraceae bacterium]